MNLVEMICKELGVEVNEIWLGTDGYRYSIDKYGFIETYDSQGVYLGGSYMTWEDIFGGCLKPIWIPKDGERYYIPNLKSNEYYDTCVWYGGVLSKRVLDRGLVFRTKEDAIECTKRLLDTIAEGSYEI